MATAEAQRQTAAQPHRLGTFAGVFTPSILTILGVILFLRAGYVVGQGGAGQALLILLVAELIVLLTALSIGAIASNTRVEGGGAYFLISRVLGPEFGGAIGLALFAAQSLSVPFYILGFGEAVLESFPALAPYDRWICLGTAALLFLLNAKGVQWALTAQFVILGLMAAALTVMLGGLALRFDAEQLAANWQPVAVGGDGFWVLFAIYFPSVTGIMAGINMSGNLRDPGRAITRGTLWAVAVGALIYAAQIILLGGAAERDQLIASPYGILIWNALWGIGFLVVAGMFSASLSSALSSFMAAPRVMRAIARDRLLQPLTWLAVGSKRGDEPLRALMLTFAITLVVLWPATGGGSGDALNQVAMLVTMFFLCTYLIMNLAAFVEAVGSNPSFRPRFRLFHWSTALFGVLGCVAAMLMIDWLNAVLALLALAVMYALISRRAYATTYGDARRGFIYATISKNLLRLRDRDMDAKNWRPTLLVLSGNPKARLPLIQAGIWLEAGRGIVTVAQLITGELSAMHERRVAALRQLRAFVRENEMQAFSEVVVAEQFDEGLRLLLQAHSLGPIKPNLVLTGWPTDPQRVGPFIRHLRDIRALGMSALTLLGDLRDPPRGAKRIDIWWRGQENGSLMLMLAHLLTLNWAWRDSEIRILRLVERAAGQEPALANMRALVDAARLEAEVEPLVSDRPFTEVFREQSASAALVFLGFHPVEDEAAEAFHTHHNRLLEGMPATILASSSGEADLLA
jgi:amino acid transporter